MNVSTITLLFVFLLTIAGCGEHSTGGETQNSASATHTDILDPMYVKTKKLISFKGIPLNQQGAVAALKKLCIEHSSNTLGDGIVNKCSPKNEAPLEGLSFRFYVDYGSLENVEAIFFVYEDKIYFMQVYGGNKYGYRLFIETLEKFYDVYLSHQTPMIKDEQGNTLSLFSNDHEQTVSTISIDTPLAALVVKKSSEAQQSVNDKHIKELEKKL